MQVQDLAAGFLSSFPGSTASDLLFFAAPGRTELLGNHTDHQRGCVLAAAVNLAARAAARPNGTTMLRLQSEGWPRLEMDLGDLSIQAEEKETTKALLRGVAAALVSRGFVASGLDIYCSSSVLPGSGLSSSAALEVLLGLVLNHFWAENRLSPVDLAIIGQQAENVYFGKPSGLMDQMASAVGGVVFIDFAEPEKPEIQALQLDLAAQGYALCILDVGANHADLTADYAAIPADMRKVAAALGKTVLREVEESAFYENLPRLRGALGDRAILRARHFFDENRRVQEAAQALKQGEFSSFLRTVKASGLSSQLYLQNISPVGAVEEQPVAYALALADRLLGEEGACRVHGGGFAGTIQAFVPLAQVEHFRQEMERHLGPASCHVLNLSAHGAMRLH